MDEATIGEEDPSTSIAQAHHPSQIPVASYAAAAAAAAAAANLDAFAANARAAVNLAPSAGPDPFYCSYRGIDTAPAVSALPLPLPNVKAPMASALSSALTDRLPPAPRLSANGATSSSKHPALAAGRSALRPCQRSTSNPVDDRSASAGGARSVTPSSGYRPGARQPSVKDLKKRFDQGTSSQPQPPQSNNHSGRATPGSVTNGRPLGAYATLRAGVARDAGNGGSQRPRFVAEDEFPANSQSFASRIGKPRTNATTLPRPSKSSSQLSPSPHTHGIMTTKTTTTTTTTSIRTNRLLFGELVSGQSRTLTAGFGIDDARPGSADGRSRPRNTVPQHVRSLSDPDAELSSPADYYRELPPRQHVRQGLPPVPSPGHSRAYSDSTGRKPMDDRMRQGLDRKILLHGSPTRTRVVAKKLETSSTSSSIASTRSNSPVASRQTTVSGRTSRQNGPPPTSRARTPTSTQRSTTPTTNQAKPFSQTPNARKAPPSSIPTANGTRSNAHVAVPPVPHLSPSLRSSRPRQSVATATTASSRMRAVDQSQSTCKAGAPSSSKGPEASRRWKLSVGPIDFAKRRETIKLAYSKTILERQAQEARDAAAEKGKREREMINARRKPETEISAEEVEAIGTHSTAPAADQASDGSVHDGSIQAQSAPRERVVHAEPLRIVTNVLGHGSAVAGPLKGLESPMLGIPGSFPALLSPRREEVDMPIPRSATSTTSMATEFDVEPQTEPPTQTATATTVETLSMTVKEPQPVATEREDGRPAPHRRSSYHSPFDMEEMSDDNASIRIALDTSAEQPSARPTPSRGELGAETQPKPASEAEPEIGHQVEADPGPELERAIPATSHEEYEARPYAYTSSTYETTVTILGPETDFRPSHSKGHVGVTTPETNELETIAETREAAVPAERLPADVELAEAAPARYAPQPHNAEQEPAAAPEERLENPEEFYVGPTLHDNVAALREATLALSDGDTSCDAPLSSAECQKTPDTSHSLTVPPLLSPANRLSQLSAWTDFSLESSDGRGTSARGSVVYLQEPEIREQSSMKSTQSRESSLQERHDAEASPLDSTGTIDADKPLISDAYLAQHRLPELNTGGGFAVPYCSTGHLRTSSSLSRSLLPSHAPPPPPPPPSSEGYVADEDVYNLDTRRSSFVRSQDGEDDDDRGPQSSSHSTAASVSVQHSELPSTAPSERNMSMSESQEPSEKERKRLQQRQLVIRELIDTEAIFIRDMTVVEEIYKGTAEACPNLDDKTVKLIFRNSDDVIAFHTVILAQLKEGVATVYAPKGRKLPLLRGDSVRDQDAESVTGNSVHAGSVKAELRDENDRMTMIGCAFIENIDKLKAVHETYLRSSDQSTKRLLQIQEDPTVKVWLDECNEVAKDLTSAWNLDSLLIKPMQRITKYPDLLTHLLKYTPDDHPDREPLMQSRTMIMDAIDEINKAKKNFELVGQIVSSRKRKDSDVRLGLARAFGKRVDKLQASKGPPEDEVYLKHQERFGDDYLRLQVVLRDVEYYTRTISAYVHEFLQYLSSIELVMRLQPSKEYAHIESKWVQFNVSMRDMEKVALERHLSDIRRHVIEPFEQVIRCYANPSEAMRKRAKRRVDYEKYVQLKAGNKKIDKQLAELNEQYEALNETLKKELPRLSALTAQVGNICLGKFVSIQTDWFRIWQAKMKMPLQDAVEHVPEVPDIVSAFQRDFRDVEEAALAMPILNPLSTVPSSVMGRTSSSQQSILTTTTTDDAASTFSKGARSVGRSEGLSVSSSVHGTPRGRGLSVTSDYVPSLPTPDFLKRHSAGFAFTTTTAMSSPNMGSGGGFGVSHGNGNGMLSSPGHYYRDYHNGTNGGANAPDVGVAGSAAGGAGGGGFSRLHPRPGSIRSYESSAVASAAGTSTTTRKSSESATPYRRDSNPYHLPGGGADGGGGRRFSGLFHSALPLPEGGAAGTEEGGSQRASSRERGAGGARYNVLWLAASLFEFNIETTKHEAGYPYLTYQAGEIFDVIAEKGELWLAKNQDDRSETVGWIWSKHFAKLADP